eukprot:scaffold5310_cov378-Prasinococcus_capsulatus_cf.AAC.3
MRSAAAADGATGAGRAVGALAAAAERGARGRYAADGVGMSSPLGASRGFEDCVRTRAGAFIVGATSLLYLFFGSEFVHFGPYEGEHADRLRSNNWRGKDGHTDADGVLAFQQAWICQPHSRNTLTRTSCWPVSPTTMASERQSSTIRSLTNVLTCSSATSGSTAW